MKINCLSLETQLGDQLWQDAGAVNIRSTTSWSSAGSEAQGERLVPEPCYFGLSLTKSQPTLLSGMDQFHQGERKERDSIK